MSGDKTHVIYFDGVCNLCNGFVQFIIKQDRKAVFKFAPLQSAAGEKVLHTLGKTIEQIDSILFEENGKVYSKSTAVLYVAKRMGGFWSLFYGFKILPRFLRDAIYDLVARNRYNWFGKKNQCMVPTPELLSRFLS